MKDLSLYIHIPFCKTICLYCNFLTFAHKNKKIPDYVEAIIKELKERSRTYKNYKIETIYFGGGTPSLIDSKFIEKILETVFSEFSVNNKPEISIECNPDSINPQKLQHYKSMGINRISLGVQTFDKKILKRLARPHDDLMIFKALDAIKQSGIKNFGADFIIGLPDQTMDQFKQELDTILKYQAPHLSFYFLSYDTKKIDMFIKDCPEEELQIKMYEYLTKKLQQEGYLHYEVSNYALPGYECTHNKRYWQQKDYLGLGVGSHSIVDKKMWENTKDFESYIDAPLQTINEMEIDAELERMESIMLNLRTNQGLNLEEYKRKYGKNESKKVLTQAETYFKSKHLVLSNNKILPTEKGFLILEAITQKLI